jgi:predicted phosphodiesterase
MGRTPRPAGSKPKARWLHISDFHFRGGDPYDRDVVLHALVKAIRRFRDEGLKPDLVFATGDVAHAGRVEEYKAATDFFDAVCKAADIDRQHLFVIAGNHDVDRDQGLWLARTLNSREEADRYFRPGTSKLHITNKLGAFVQWYNGYFEGIRSVPLDTTCGPVEAVDVRGFKIGVLPLNSAPFCQDDHDHAKLWIGRRCLDAALEQLDTLGAALNVALVHHPLDWLSDTEASNIKTALANKVDVVLRGHLHQTDVESVAGVSGQILNIAAGAAYQTRLWPNRALYTTIDGNTATIFPIRYEDQPQEVWVIDPSVFPTQPKYEGKFPIARLSGAPQLRPEEHIDEPPPVTAVLRRFQSNIRTRRNLPFVGRDDC